MTETAAVLTRDARASLRYARLAGLHAQLARIGLQIRQETAALVEDDTPFALRTFVADELSMAIAESPGTCRRLVEDARLTVAYPRLMAHAAASIETVLTHAAAGVPVVLQDLFGVRHLDAVLDELAGTPAELVDPVLDLVLADDTPGGAARTPYQLRQATRAARMLLDLTADADRQDRLHDERSVTLLEEARGGASLYLSGTKTKAAEMLACIDAHVATPAPGDTRSLAQRRYDFVYGLLCGQIQVTAPWQALIVVALDTVEGSDTPAEIPGLGLVTAAEAREVLAQADLRRALVDSDGQLVSLDNTLTPSDQQPLGPAAADLTVDTAEPDLVDDADDPELAATAEEWAWLAAQEALIDASDCADEAGLDSSDEAVEPPLVDDPEPSATAEDWAWLAAQEAQAEQREQEGRREAQLLRLCHHGLQHLDSYLRAHATVPAGSALSAFVTPDLPHDDDPDDPDDDPPGGSRGPGDRPGPVRPGGDGRGTPTTPPSPDDTPPSSPADTNADANADTDTATSSATDVGQPRARTPAWAPSYRAQQLRRDRLERQARTSRWTTPGLHAALTGYRTRPPDPIPPASKGYPFRGRLARWIKTRDLGCVFPGCPYQAQRCQLDHLLEYPQGKTEHCNGACECVHHHQCKHACMTVTRHPDGTITWTNRHGLTRTRPPRPLLRGW